MLEWIARRAEHHGTSKARIVYAGMSVYQTIITLQEHGELIMGEVHIDGRHQPKPGPWQEWLRENRPHLFEEEYESRSPK